MFSVFRSLCSESKTVILATSVTRDRATYNCPWQKTKRQRFKPTVFNDWLCDLLIVIAKHDRTGNCLWVKIKDNSPSTLVRGMRGIIFNSPSWSLPKCWPSRLYRPMRVKINWESLFNPPDWSIFRNNITGAPNFKCNFEKERPGVSHCWRFSVDISNPSSSFPSAESSEKISWSSLANRSNNSVFIVNTASLKRMSIARDR